MEKSSATHHEKVPKNIIAPPAVDTLLHPEQDSLWPADIRNNVELKRQAEARNVLKIGLETVFEKIPKADMELSEAVDGGMLQADELASVYDSISDMLEADIANERIVLYLPFEMIPHKDWTVDSESLMGAKKRFTDTYAHAWHGLLRTKDARANFSDGDFSDGEVTTGDFPRVVKAAHMIPKLLEKDIIKASAMLEYMANAADETVFSSVCEGLSVASELGLLASHEEEYLKRLHDARSPTRAVRSRESEGDIPLARAQWLLKEKKRIDMETFSSKIAKSAEEGSLSKDDFIGNILLGQDADRSVAGVHGLRKMLESMASTDMGKAQAAYEDYSETLAQLWENKNTETQDALMTLWSYLSKLHVIDKTALENMGVSIPRLDAEQVTGDKNITENAEKLKSAMEAIGSHPELSRYIYPVSILYGSQVKGYARNDSDQDVAIFVRPQVSLEDREVFRVYVKEIFSAYDIKSEPVELWLSEDMSVRNIDVTDSHIGHSWAISSLFEGVTCGDEETVKMLHERVMSQYVYSEGKKEIGGTRDAREIWLGELERNTLQYRLMHKGYANFFPRVGGNDMQGRVEIDGDSRFWDSGYRRLATKLFTTKVFLPQLQK